MCRVRQPHYTHQPPVLRAGEKRSQSFAARQQALAADLYENMDNNRFERSAKYERVRVTCESQNVFFSSTFYFIHFLSNFQNGNIFVFTGMLDICTTDDELGMVLGHEISHCLLGHAVS